MNFFNIDMHISVIEDLKTIYADLGHNINSLLLSGHSWVLGREKDTLKFPIKVEDCITPELQDRFYEAYPELNEYDGFICCYPPAFAPLFTRFNKPIIMQIPIRYEFPYTGNREMWGKFNSWLGSYKKLIVCANNKFDKWWFESNTGVKCRHIPSLCSYTNTEYSANNGDYLLYSKKDDGIQHPRIKRKEQVLNPGYTWDALTKFRGIVHVPYQVSTMSIFEQYTTNIPLIMPTPQLLRALCKRRIALTEVHWGRKQTVDWSKVVEFADYYDKEWMPGITYYNSFRQLPAIIDEMDRLAGVTSAIMQGANVRRKDIVYNAWEEELSKIC